MNSAPEEFEFSETKFRELMLYLAARSIEDPGFGATKLNKLLFYVDFLAYGLHGKPITGATYRRLSRGPAPRQLLKIQESLVHNKEAVVVERAHFNRKQRRLFPLREPDLTPFSATEISLVDEVIETFRHEDATHISQLSHQEMAWRLARDNEDIPYELVFISAQPPTPNDIERGRELASRHGWIGRHESETDSSSRSAL